MSSDIFDEMIKLKHEFNKRDYDLDTESSDSAYKLRLAQVEKQLLKANRRLAEKNAKMMALNKARNLKHAEIEELRSKLKDLEFLIEEKDKLASKPTQNEELKAHIEHLRVQISSKENEIESTCSIMNNHKDEIEQLKRKLAEHEASKSSMVDEKAVKRIHELEQSNARLESQISELNKDVTKKNAIIELMQKPEYDYKGIVTLDLERVSAKWVGWPEGANVEELDYIVVNNSDEALSDVSLDVYIEDSNGNVHKMENINVKNKINPKERVSRKIHLFKQLKKRGNYKVEVRVYVQKHTKELAKQSKILTI